MKINKEKKLIFWLAILMGIVAGAIGNFWAGSYFNMLDKNFELLSILTFGAFTLFFVAVIINIYKRIKKIENIKRGRPKSKIKK